MKKLLLAVSLLLAACAPSSALSFSDIGRDIRDHTKLPLLESGQPSYFYNIGDQINSAAFTTPLISYRSLSGVVGWAGGYDDKTVGTFLAGGQMSIHQFIKDTFPDFFSTLGDILPESVARVADKVRVGPAVGYNFSENKFVYGMIGGLEFKF